MCLKLRNSLNSLAFIQQRYKHNQTEFEPLKRAKRLTDFKRGTGGRSSFNGIVATIFGATGFLGRYVANRLGKIGTQMIIPYRGAMDDVRYLKLAGDLGQVLYQPFNLDDIESIKKCMKYSNTVINLIGRDWETKNYSFWDVHVNGAQCIAKLAKEAGVETFIHVSSLNVGPIINPYMLKYGSQWLESKYEGELAVKEVFPEAIIFRPSDIYGQEDRFLRYYCSQWRHSNKYMPLYKYGEETVKQPVYVSDLAAAITMACLNRCLNGKIIQAVGPKKYLLSELIDWFHRLMRKTKENWGYFRTDIKYNPIFKLKISLLPLMTTGRPFGNLHWERVEREAINDCIDKKLLTLEDLDIKLTEMENQVPWEIKTYQLHKYYEKEAMEIEEIEPPKTYTTDSSDDEEEEEKV